MPGGSTHTEDRCRGRERRKERESKSIHSSNGHWRELLWNRPRLEVWREPGLSFALGACRGSVGVGGRGGGAGSRRGRSRRGRSRRGREGARWGPRASRLEGSRGSAEAAALYGGERRGGTEAAPPDRLRGRPAEATPAKTAPGDAVAARDSRWGAAEAAAESLLLRSKGRGRKRAERGRRHRRWWWRDARGDGTERREGSALDGSDGGHRCRGLGEPPSPPPRPEGSVGCRRCRRWRSARGFPRWMQLPKPGTPPSTSPECGVGRRGRTGGRPSLTLQWWRPKAGRSEPPAAATRLRRQPPRLLRRRSERGVARARGRAAGRGAALTAVPSAPSSPCVPVGSREGASLGRRGLSLSAQIGDASQRPQHLL